MGGLDDGRWRDVRWGACTVDDGVMGDGGLGRWTVERCTVGGLYGGRWSDGWWGACTVGDGVMYGGRWSDVR
jgi:hypothetical protein